MAVELSSRVVALIDSDQECRQVLAYAKALPGPLTILASVDTKLVNNEPDVVRSLAAEPPMSQVLALAGERGAPWVVMRRGVTSPEALITELIVGAGKADTEAIPGFGVLLVSDEPRPTQRTLVVADRTHGPMSGLMMYMAARVARNSGAVLDVLVIGGPGEDVSSDDGFDALTVNREQEYFEAAQELAAAAGVQFNWIAAGDIDRPDEMVAAQLAMAEYDLIIDDIGDLAIGGALRTGIDPVQALAPGQVGAVPLSLLSQTDIDLLLVFDAIRVGMLSRRLLAVGAAAAAALAVITGAGAGAGGDAGTGADLGDATASGTTSEAGTQSQQVLDELSQASATVERKESVDSSSRSAKRGSKGKSSGATKGKSTSKPKTPKGGVDNNDLAKQEKAERKSRRKFQKAKAAADRAEDAAAAAADDFQDTRAEAERAQLEITAAQQAQEEAVLTSQMASFSASTLSQTVAADSVVEAIDSADEEQADAQAWLAGATARGEQAIADLEAAQKAAEKAAGKAESAEDKAQQAKARYEVQKEKTDVFEANLVDLHQLPMEKGSFHYSAHYGQRGSAWSKGYHTGLDFAAATGTNVYAAASGKVIEVGYDGAYGNRIVIQHEDGTRSSYNHLSDTDVSGGQHVDAGDHIGDVGNTGNSFGSHLHFEVTRGGDGWSGGTFLDPEDWFSN